MSVRKQNLIKTWVRFMRVWILNSEVMKLERRQRLLPRVLNTPFLGGNFRRRPIQSKNIGSSRQQQIRCARSCGSVGIYALSRRPADDATAGGQAADVHWAVRRVSASVRRYAGCWLARLLHSSTRQQINTFLFCRSHESSSCRVKWCSNRARISTVK